MSQSLSLTPKAWAGLLGLAFVWGFSFLAMRIALDEIGPHNVVAHRVSWAAAAMLIYISFRRIPFPRSPQIWAAFIVMGLLNNVIPFSLIAWGQQYIETGLASIINASTAIWGIFVAAVFLPDERLTGRKALGVMLGFAGVVMAIGLSTLQSLDLRSLGQLAIIASSLSYALAGVWARKRMKGVAPEMAATGMLIGSTIVAIPLAVVIEGSFDLTLQARTWGALAYVSLIATAMAYLLYYRVLVIAGSGNLMLCTLLVAPVAIVAGAVVLGEALPPQAYGGFAVLALGLVILDGRAWDKLTGKKPLAKPDHQG